MSDQSHIEELLRIHERSLKILEKQQATMAPLTPVHIVAQIEDKKAEIRRLKIQLRDEFGVDVQLDDEVADEEQQTSSEAKLSTNRNPNKQVFISYAWGGESEKIVDQLDEAFQAKGVTILRDTREVGYKDRIKQFMEQMGQGQCVIAVISKQYLESKNCMFELVQISKHGQFYDRIFPIILKDANIYDPVDRIQYVQHWEAKAKKLDEAMRTVSAANMQGFREDIDLYTDIRATIAELTDILRDMNALTPDLHRESDFEELYNAVMAKLDG